MRNMVSRIIEATPEVIWDLLTEASAYLDWNPAVVGIEGEIREGETIKLTSSVNPERQFSLKVSEVEPPHHMVWWDGMPLGLFRGTRRFDVARRGDGSSEFEMGEGYTGLMAPLITRSIPDMTDSFEEFADGLKVAAESR
ncbi:MAG: SRPBCC family protein [Acidimicrobiia bacterium]